MKPTSNIDTHIEVYDVLTREHSIPLGKGMESMTTRNRLGRIGPIRVVFKLKPQEVFVVVKLFDPIHDEDFASIKIFLKEKYYEDVKKEWSTRFSAHEDRAEDCHVSTYAYTSFMHEAARMAHMKMMQVFQNLWRYASEI
jgi:hypothetical protein